MTTTDCREIEKIRLMDAPTDEQLELVKDHIRDCEDCRVEVRTLELSGLDDGCSPAPPLDDLAKRRWVEQALSRNENQPSATISPLKRRLVSWIAAAAILLVGIWVVLTTFSKVPENEEQVAMKPSPEQTLHGEILLLSGKVSQKLGETPLEKIKVGRNIATEDGYAALTLASRAKLIARKRTSFSVVHLDKDKIEVALETGTILLSVESDENWPFHVSTKNGRVVVVGTAFSVKAEEGKDPEVDVFYGEVRLEHESGSKSTVGFGKRGFIGTEKIEQIPKELLDSTTDELRVLDLIRPIDESAKLKIESLPAGALVKVDEAVLGRTPLVANLSPGRRPVEISLNEYESVREIIDLSPGHVSSRHFVLTSSVEDRAPPSTTIPGDRASDIEKPDPSTSAAELLVKARSLRKARQFEAAARAYQHLIKKFGDTPQARSSLVSLGLIQLEQLNQPKKALASCNNYLAITGTGPLAEEALFCRAKAFKALGRTQLERDALTQFLARFPSSVQAGRARERLAEIEGNE